MSYFGSRAISRSLLWLTGHHRDSPTATSTLQAPGKAGRRRLTCQGGGGQPPPPCFVYVASARQSREEAAGRPLPGRSISDRWDRRCFRSGHFVRQQRCLLAPVRRLLVLDDSAEQEEEQ